MKDKQTRADVACLTGLRGVAALWVIGFHCHLLLPSHPLPDLPFGWGYLGVDVFFMLSGFIMASLYADLRPATCGSFFLRRAFRIFPLHLSVMVVLGVIVLLTSASGHAPTPYYAPQSFVPVLLLVQVPTGLTGWNDPAWSISVEMICYLSLPFLLPLAIRIDRRWCLAIIAVLLLCDTALLALYGPRGAYDSVNKLSGWFPIVRGGLGFYAGCLAATRVDMHSLGRSWIWKPLAWRPIVFVGDISFSLYLIHQPILSLGKRLDPLLAGHGASLLLLPCLASIVLALSLATYHFIEQPGRRIPAIMARRRLEARVRPLRQGTTVIADH